MSASQQTGFGSGAKTKKRLPPPIVRKEPPTIDEAAVAALGLAEDLEQRIVIAAGLMGVSPEDAREAVVRAMAVAPTPLSVTRPSGHVAVRDRIVTVERTNVRRVVLPRNAGPIRLGRQNAITPRCFDAPERLGARHRDLYAGLMKPAPIALLTVCGLEELSEHAASRVTHVLSILDPDRADPTEFGAWGEHRRLTLRFHDAIEPGPGVELPQREHVEAIIRFVDDIVAEERQPGRDPHVLIHCHVGVSRSTAAMLILLARTNPQSDDAELVERLFAIRDKAWPNARMVAFADEILGRGGRLSEAVRRLHAKQMVLKPHLEELMTELGRGREVRAALA